jgi:hypothetical protein
MRSRLAFALVASLALVAPLTGSVGADEHDHDHAEHSVPGNPIAVAVTENAQLIDSDGGSSGGHVMTGSTSAPMASVSGSSTSRMPRTPG